MAVLNLRDLRAFVRIDGMGRDVAGSLIYRKNKPKVGNWREIRAEACCDPWFDQTTTTTTSSTSSTTSTTTTAPSDIRLKANIIVTGNMVNGLREYSWTWNEKAIALGLSGYKTTGVMAQEAVNLYPDAVLLGSDGYFRVDYSKLG